MVSRLCRWLYKINLLPRSCLSEIGLCVTADATGAEEEGPEEVDDPLIKTQKRTPRRHTDVLIDVPPASRPEQLVQAANVIRLIGNAAEAQDRDDAVDGAGLDGSAGPGGGVGEGLDADGDDLVDVVDAEVADALAESGGGFGVGFHAVDFGDVVVEEGGFAASLAQAVPIPSLLFSISAAGIGANLGKHVGPHARPGADFDDHAASRWHTALTTTAVRDDFASAHATLKQRHDAALGVALDRRPDGGPKVAKQGVAEARGGQEGVQVAGAEELDDSGGDVAQGDAHEEPRVEEEEDDVLEGL
jgi:hypothetical protein